MSNLLLPVKREYFEQIKSGEKKYEFRLYNDFWFNRIFGKDFDKIIITLGYPKRNDESRRIIRPYYGYEITEIVHKHFGPDKVKVFAICVNGEPP